MRLVNSTNRLFAYIIQSEGGESKYFLYHPEPMKNLKGRANKSLIWHTHKFYEGLTEDDQLEAAAEKSKDLWETARIIGSSIPELEHDYYCTDWRRLKEVEAEFISCHKTSEAIVNGAILDSRKRIL